MAGNNSIRGDETVTFTDNMSFDGTERGGKMTTNGELWIGATSAPHVKKGSLTSPLGTLTIGYSSPNITLDLAGGSAVETLTPDSGGAVTPVANNINVLGYQAGATQVMETFNVGNIFKIADRTFLTRYVVDTNVANGQSGTYSTLQSAITQAIIDGATGNPGLCIYVRNATINETITVSTAGVNLTILGTGGKSTFSIANGNPVFTGSFTNSGTGIITFSNIDFSAAATLTNSSTGGVFVNNCTFSGTFVSSSANGSLNANNTLFFAATGTLSRGTVTIYSCIFTGGTITFSNDASFGMYYSTMSSGLAGITSSALSFNNCYITLGSNTLTGGTLINFNSTFSASNYYGNASVTYQMANSTAGNTYQATRTAISYVVVANQDYYIGVTSTAAGRTITLPSTSVIKNQSYIVKDESGGAAANNISVVVAGGVKTIDGATTYTIASNYGSIRVIYDGTNYFVI